MSVLVLWAEAELVMRVVVPKLLSSRGRRCAGGARLFLHRTQPEVLSVPGLQIVIGRPPTRSVFIDLSALFQLLLDALLPPLFLNNRLDRVIARFADFVYARQPLVSRRQASDRMGDPRDDIFRVVRQCRGNSRHVGRGIIGVTRAITAEEQFGPLRCVARRRLCLGHRSWQFFDRDRQPLE